MGKDSNGQEEFRVVVVEDNPADVRIIEEYLASSSNYKFEVSNYQTLTDALNANLLADIVLLDLSLSDSSGIETLSIFRKKYSLLPVILLTGHDDISLARKAIQEGAQDYIVKGTFIAREIIRAITHAIERHVLREELVRSKISAESASKAKSNFLANMSHEIRTPMNAIVGGVSLLQETPLNEEQQYWIQIIQAGAGSLLEVIDDILDFSKIEADKLNIEILEFSVTECIDEVLKTVSSRVSEKGLELICDIKPSVPCIVSSDSKRLRQIIINLLSNAIKFTHEGEVRLVIDFVKGNEPELVFKVIDTGIGVSEEMRDVIFDSFTQADSSTSRKYGGTGLGLAISRRLTELLGGKIWFEDNEPAGSQFCFNIKIEDDYVENDWSREEKLVTGKRILIVDENKVSRKILQDMLELWGGKVDFVNTDEEAATVLREDAKVYELIFIDFSLIKSIDSHLSRLLSDALKGDDLPIVMLCDAGNYSRLLESYKGLYCVSVNKPLIAGALHNVLRTVINKIFKKR